MRKLATLLTFFLACLGARAQDAGFSQTSPPFTVTSSSSVASGTYTSGITATGTIGQTCALTALNGAGSDATATVALTGTNTIAGGTALVITAAGSGYTSAPTSATAGSGTATCSGTATIATVLTPISVTAAGYYVCDIAAGCVYNMPAAPPVGILEVVIFNKAARTGVIKIVMPTATVLDINGVNGSSAGSVSSAGGAGDMFTLWSKGTGQYKGFGNEGAWTPDGSSPAPAVNNASCTGATIGTGATNTAGTITGLPTGTCTVVLTFSVATAAHGWSCGVSDQTTGNLFRQAANSTTTVTFNGTSVSGDVLAYGPCAAY